MKRRSSETFAHCVSYSSWSSDKTCGKHNLRKGGTVQERGAAGHVAATVRSREMDAGAQLASSSVFSPGRQTVGWFCPHFGWVFPPQLIQCLKILRDIPEVCPLGGSRHCQHELSQPPSAFSSCPAPAPTFVTGYHSWDHELEEVPAPGLLLLL